MVLWQRTEHALAEHPVLGELTFASMDLAGRHALVSRLVPAERAYDLWRAARGLGRELGTVALLTHDDQVHPDIEAVEPGPTISLAEARERRERVVRTSEEAADALDALRSATPQPEAYQERDVFLDDPLCDVISLVIFHGTLAEAVLPFTPAGEAPFSEPEELVALLEHLVTTHGAEPLYATGRVLELEVERPPSDLIELRELARDFLFLSWGRAEGYGVEEPARLLRRRMGHRWLVWWYGL